MISRCPSCAAEVDEDASRCPSCHWDFELRKRVPPDGEAAKPEAPAKPSKPPPSRPPSPEPSLPASASMKVGLPPAKEKPKDETAAKKKQEEPPSLPTGFGLKQFGKINPPPKKTEEEKEEKNERPSEGDQAGFSIPAAKGGQKEEEYKGPPATEVHFIPKDKLEKKGKPEVKEKPEPKGDREKEKEKEREKPSKDTPAKAVSEKEKERQDAAERFKKRGKTDPKGKAPTVAAKSAFDPKLAAGVIAVLLITIVGIYLGMRSDGGAGKAGPMKIGTERLTRKIDALVTDNGPDRDIRHIQRVVVDQGRPETAPTQVAPTPAPPPPPAPAPAPAPAGTTWTFEGQAYDLITLKPIRGARLAFRVLGGEATVAGTTDDRGRFKVVVPVVATGGYDLTTSHPDYLDGFIDEMSPPLKEADLDERRLLAAQAATNARWQAGPKGLFKRDIILIPKVVPPDAP